MARRIALFGGLGLTFGNLLGVASTGEIEWAYIGFTYALLAIISFGVYMTEKRGDT